MKKKPILCLDFDGVIHSYSSGWKGPRKIPDAPVPGALQFLVTAMNIFEVHIFSSRSNYFGGRRAMRKWLIYQFDQLTMRCRDNWVYEIFHVYEKTTLGHNRKRAVRYLIGQIKFPRYKPPAVCTIDDRAMRFNGKFESPLYYLNLKPWNKK